MTNINQLFKHLLSIVFLTVLLIGGPQLHAQEEEAFIQKLEAVQTQLGIKDSIGEKIKSVYKTYTVLLRELNGRKFTDQKSKKMAKQGIANARKIELINLLGSESKLIEFQQQIKVEMQKDKPRALTDDEKLDLGQKVRAYKKEIFHFIKTERNELDELLDEKSKLQIEEYRTALNLKVKTIGQKKIECKQQKAGSKRAFMKCRKDLKLLEQEMKEEYKLVNAFFKEKETLVLPFLTRFAAQKGVWANEINNYIAAYFNTTAENTLAYAPKANIFLKNINKFNFLLLNPELISLENTSEELSEGLEHMSTSNLTVLNGKLFLQTSNTEINNAVLTLYDANGTNVKTFETANGESLDLEGLPLGLYNCKVETTGEIWFQKLVLL